METHLLFAIGSHLTFVTSVLSQYMQNSYQLHWIIVCRALKYLKSAPNKELYYQPSSHWILWVILMVIRLEIL